MTQTCLVCMHQTSRSREQSSGRLVGRISNFALPICTLSHGLLGLLFQTVPNVRFSPTRLFCCSCWAPQMRRKLLLLSRHNFGASEIEIKGLRLRSKVPRPEICRPGLERERECLQATVSCGNLNHPEPSAVGRDRSHLWSLALVASQLLLVEVSGSGSGAEC